MSMLKKLANRFLFLATAISATTLFAAASLETITNENLAGEFSHLQNVWRAVGMVQFETGNHQYRVQSGFFIAPDLFITARDPDKTAVGIDCTKDVTISTGFVSLPNEDLTKLPKNYRCTQVVASKISEGFTVLRVEPIGGNGPAPYLPIAKAKSIRGGGTVSILGYYNANGSLTFSDQCVIGTAYFYPPLQMKRQSPNVQMEKGIFATADCVYLKGMYGAPVLVREGGEWAVAGIFSTIIPADEAKRNDTIYHAALFSKLPALVSKYGTDLSGAGIDPNPDPNAAGASGSAPGGGAGGGGGGGGGSCPGGGCNGGGGGSAGNAGGGGSCGGNGGTCGTCTCGPSCHCMNSASPNPNGNAVNGNNNGGAMTTNDPATTAKLEKAKLLAAQDMAQEAPTTGGFAGTAAYQQYEAECRAWQARWAGHEDELVKYADTLPRNITAGVDQNLVFWAKKYDEKVKEYLAQLP